MSQISIKIHIFKRKNKSWSKSVTQSGSYILLVLRICRKRTFVHKKKHAIEIKESTQHVTRIVHFYFLVLQSSCLRFCKVKACSNETDIIQHCWANNVARCWAKILSKFKLKPTSFNIVFKRGQHHTTLLGEQCCTMLGENFKQV